MPARAVSNTAITYHPPCSKARLSALGTVRRVPAVEIETQVIKSVRGRLKLPGSIDDRSLIDRHVTRVEVQSERLVIQLVPPQKPDRSRAGLYTILNVPW